jgi:hypothetical protein|tara:strand:- start:295 stop:546 length:252 start_codon:yes stop_codon:yes gene_type:complete
VKYLKNSYEIMKTMKTKHTKEVIIWILMTVIVVWISLALPPRLKMDMILTSISYAICLFGWIGFATRALNNAEIKQKGKTNNE